MTWLLKRALRRVRFERLSVPKKPKFDLVFKPSLLRIKVVALPLAPPPQPYFTTHVNSNVINWSTLSIIAANDH